MKLKSSFKWKCTYKPAFLFIVPFHCVLLKLGPWLVSNSSFVRFRLIATIQGFKLIFEYFDSPFVHNKDVVRFCRSLCCWIELTEKFFGLTHHLALVGWLLWRLALNISLLQITETCTNHQLNSGWFPRSERIVEWIVANVVDTQHLIFKICLIWFIIKLTLAKFPLSQIALSDDACHQRWPSFVYWSEGWNGQIFIIKNVFDDVGVSSEARPIEVTSMSC